LAALFANQFEKNALEVVLVRVTQRPQSAENVRRNHFEILRRDTAARVR